jgi:phytanoyl-CoA hydroxylase
MTELAEQFEHDGFVVLPGFVDRDACERLRDAALALVDAQDLDALASVFDAGGQSHGLDPWFLDSGGEVRAFLEPERDAGLPRVNKLGHAMHDRIPVFEQFSRTPALAELVAELGLAEPLLLQSMVIFKHPRVGGEVPAHQDATYLHTEPVSVLGLWFALEPATRDNGCLEVLPGGHRLGLRQRYRRNQRRAWTQVLDPRPWPDDGWLAIEAEVGTLVAFHGLLPHRSRANRSEQSRCAYTLHVIDARAEYSADNWLRRPADLPLRGF